jgi:IS5 family transposase
MGRQHRERKLPTREENIARLRAQGLSEQEIGELVSHADADLSRKAQAQQVAQAQAQAETRPKTRYHLRNWRAYNQALVQPGSLTFWFDEESQKQWCRNMHPEQAGRPTIYSDAAILCALTLKAVFRLRLRQSQGFLASLLELLQLELPTPDYSTICRRSKRLDVDLDSRPRSEPLHVVVDSTGLKVFGEGEWMVRQHRWKKRRTWRKLHLAVDEATGEVVAQLTTERDVTDDAVLPELLTEIEAKIEQVSADGAYDTFACYEAIEARGARPVIPPDANAVDHGSEEARDRTVRRVGEIGRTAWKVESGYHRRSLAETAMFRLKTIFGPQLTARSLANQQTEAAIRCRALNRITRAGMPLSYPVQDRAT